jgi:hypothetical protein
MVRISVPSLSGSAAWGANVLLATTRIDAAAAAAAAVDADTVVVVVVVAVVASSNSSTSVTSAFVHRIIIVAGQQQQTFKAFVSVFLIWLDSLYSSKSANINQQKYQISHEIKVLLIEWL